MSGLFLFLFLLSSCGTKIPRLEKLDNPTSTIPIQDFIDDDKKEIVYDMSIQFKEDYNSGLLAAVMDAPGFYRLVFLTKAGPKLFDLSFTPQNMTVNAAIDALDKKLLWYILEKDFRFIFDPKDFKELNYFRQHESDQIVIRAKEGAFRHYYFDNNNKLNQVLSGKKKRYNVAMNVEYDPKSYKLEHQNIALKINLTELSHKNRSK